MRTSVTKLDSWQECQVKYRYSQRRLKEHGYVPSGPLTSGSTFHDSLERGLMTKNMRDATNYTLNVLDDDNRFRPGVLRMLKDVPEWLLDVEIPVAEDKLEVSYIGREEITIVGKPDLWTVKDYGVVVYEFKTCSEKGKSMLKKLLNYEEWGSQPTRYAWLLQQSYDWLEGLPFYRQHILWSTQDTHIEGKEILISQDAIDNAGQDMIRLADQIEETEFEKTAPIHHFTPLCNWCDFQQVCRGWLTGADVDGIIAEKYYEEEYVAH
jgi:CRISPR/Cas system-associated exonuclease Cas4 (RecB family)